MPGALGRDDGGGARHAESRGRVCAAESGQSSGAVAAATGRRGRGDHGKEAGSADAGVLRDTMLVLDRAEKLWVKEPVSNPARQTTPENLGLCDLHFGFDGSAERRGGTASQSGELRGLHQQAAGAGEVSRRPAVRHGVDARARTWATPAFIPR